MIMPEALLVLSLAALTTLIIFFLFLWKILTSQKSQLAEIIQQSIQSQATTTDLIAQQLSKALAMLGTKDPLAFQAVQLTALPLTDEQVDQSDDAEAERFNTTFGPVGYTMDPFDFDVLEIEHLNDGSPR